MENSYDVFICCRDRDSEGVRTFDKTLAQVAADILESAGAEVYISGSGDDMAACDASALMLIIAASGDSIENQRVKSLWSRYMNAAQNGGRVFLCHFGLKRGGFPAELDGIPALDLTKKGAFKALKIPVLKALGMEDKDITPSGKGFRTGSGVYYGQTANGRAHGKGILFYNNGAVYDGMWQSGKKDGNGRMIYPDGRRCMGVWRHNEEWNCIGYAKYENGCSFFGEWRDGRRTGYGLLVNADGSRWYGIWKDDDVWSGEGVVVYSSGNRFDGRIEDGCREGQGRMDYADGGYWEGTWAHDAVCDGYGTVYYKNGDYYVGDWKNGQRHGQGTIYYKEQGKWSGRWEHDKQRFFSVLDLFSKKHKQEGETE